MTWINVEGTSPGGGGWRGMTRTASAASLLHAACQDLHAGKAMQAARLPGLLAAAGEALGALIRAEADRAKRHAARFTGAGLETDGPANLWMAGILDDAERDAKNHQAGRLRDVALIGALRKAKAAEIVSSETAIALAGEIGEAGLSAVVTANRDEEIASDRALRTMLLSSTGHGGAMPG